MLTIKSTPLYLGTSGYQHDDWIGNFYPEGINHYEMFDYYMSRFNFVEITFTFYKIPYKNTIQSIMDRINRDIFFSIRLHKDFLRGKYSHKELGEFLEGLSPFLNNGRIKAFFADYNYKFSASKQNIELIEKIRKDFPSDIPFFVELPNITWFKERFLDNFKTKKIGLIGLHMPNIRGLAPFYPINTNFYTYLRLYGKSRLWVLPDDKELNYNYKTEELKNILESCVDASVLSKEAFISFCNVGQGHAPDNALKVKRIIEQEYGG